LTGGLVKEAQTQSERGDAYWQSTREQLRSAQNRADVCTLSGLAAICGLLWLYHEPGHGFDSFAQAGLGIALVVICVPVWLATRSKRRISAARLTCKHCGAVPHDTEISEVASTHQCQRCAQSID
jgi:hypothetical protein